MSHSSSSHLSFASTRFSSCFGRSDLSKGYYYRRPTPRARPPLHYFLILTRSWGIDNICCCFVCWPSRRLLAPSTSPAHNKTKRLLFLLLFFTAGETRCAPIFHFITPLVISLGKPRPIPSSSCLVLVLLLIVPAGPSLSQSPSNSPPILGRAIFINRLAFLRVRQL